VFVLVPLLVLFGVGAVLFGVEVFELYREPIDATNDYLADVRAGRYEEAYAGLCIQTRLSLSEADYVAGQQADERELGPITSYRIFESNLDSDGDARTSGEVVRGGRSYDEEFVVREEGGRWRVCGFPGERARS
jgi:hypothetical protein